MAIVKYTTPNALKDAWVVAWEGLTTGDTGTPFSGLYFGDRTVQIGGTLNGATVKLEGTIDGTNYIELTDPQGNAISYTSAKIEAITEMVVGIRPSVTGGTSPSINVYMLVRRA